MKDLLPKPAKGSIFYSDTKVYACLASYPKAKGHSVVVWKKQVSDIHSLSRKDYLHLMTVVEDTRDAMRSVLGVEKVYLIYMDEAKHVHWHLVPRRKLMGFALLNQKPKLLEDFSLAKILKEEMKKK
ncbi:HIT family protein [archaeon]|jgi:diadenosine tetraphosphate (Ap4A) HIT family hydrolase|nr:HIT family protein [archaeon]MBT6762027.1 HIT family protein [archaeon]